MRRDMPCRTGLRRDLLADRRLHVLLLAFQPVRGLRASLRRAVPERGGLRTPVRREHLRVRFVRRDVLDFRRTRLRRDMSHGAGLRSGGERLPVREPVRLLSGADVRRDVSERAGLRPGDWRRPLHVRHPRRNLCDFRSTHVRRDVPRRERLRPAVRRERLRVRQLRQHVLDIPSADVRWDMPRRTGLRSGVGL
jgi:hypothetical protein